MPESVWLRLFLIACLFLLIYGIRVEGWWAGDAVTILR